MISAIKCISTNAPIEQTFICLNAGLHQHCFQLVCCQFDKNIQLRIEIYVNLSYVFKLRNVGPTAMVARTPDSCASCQIRKIAGCACAGNAGNVFPATDFKGSIPARTIARASRMCRDTCRDRKSSMERKTFPAFLGACVIFIVAYTVLVDPCNLSIHNQQGCFDSNAEIMVLLQWQRRHLGD